MIKKRRKNDKEEEKKIRGVKGGKDVYLTGRQLFKYDETLFKNEEDDGSDDEEEKYEKKEQEDDGEVREITFGIDEEEAELDKEIAKAKGMKIEEDLFDDEDDADDVDLDDLE